MKESAIFKKWCIYSKHRRKAEENRASETIDRIDHCSIWRNNRTGKKFIP